MKIITYMADFFNIFGSTQKSEKRNISQLMQLTQYEQQKKFESDRLYKIDQVMTGRDFNTRFGYLTLIKITDENIDSSTNKSYFSLQKDPEFASQYKIPANKQRGISFCSIHQLDSLIDLKKISTMKYAWEIEVPDGALVFTSNDKFVASHLFYKNIYNFYNVDTFKHFGIQFGRNLLAASVLLDKNNTVSLKNTINPTILRISSLTTYLVDHGNESWEAYSAAIDNNNVDMLNFLFTARTNKIGSVKPEPLVEPVESCIIKCIRDGKSAMLQNIVLTQKRFNNINLNNIGGIFLHIAAIYYINALTFNGNYVEYDKVARTLIDLGANPYKVSQERMQQLKTYNIHAYDYVMSFRHGTTYLMRSRG